MKTIKLKVLILGLIFLTAIAGAHSQNVFRLLSESSSLQITGTSSIHDWEMKASDFNSEALLQIGHDKTVLINQVEFSCPVAGISSGNRIMDNKTYKALKEEKYPLINFLINPQNNVKLSEDNNIVTGLLTVGGITKEVNLPCNVTFKSSDRFKISGEVPLKMSDFDIEPPTAMLGALKTGDKVVVKFDFEFNMSSQELTKNR
jgi:polyisoprenoid-binding protein YceI